MRLLENVGVEDFEKRSQCEISRRGWGGEISRKGRGGRFLEKVVRPICRKGRLVRFLEKVGL